MQLDINILTGKLVWMNGSFATFIRVLRHYPEPGKQVAEADNWYTGHMDKIKCPGNACNLEENLEMLACISTSHEPSTA